TQQPFGKMQNKSGIKIPQRKIKINIKPTLHEVLHFAKRQNVVRHTTATETKMEEKEKIYIEIDSLIATIDNYKNEPIFSVEK
ncbi:hypothetical protein, partial [Flavobacterium psychrophilum]|uniref:hypothetical protein n=1 Tax=Flavobacterium psychrophilum TaxID=96345 RepID=UPI000B25D614